jgi:tartrate-resistant acid phosphatase type 5
MNNPLFATSLTRREAIKKTVIFSTGLLAPRFLPRAQAVPLDTDFSGPGLNLLAVGDYGSKNDSQLIVAQQMARFAKKLNQPLDAVLALGDNFYGKMTPERFDRDFEKMYDAAAMPCPFYACIGNHDYERVAYGSNPEPRKCEVELDYARTNPTSRWKMPSKWYAQELTSSGKPLLKVIVLDSNMQEGALTPQEKLAQRRFLESELAKGTKAPWLWLVWHHPLFTETTKRKDNPSLLRTVEDALKTYPFSFCLSGHDHNLQHLQVEGYSTSFIVSGAGGANRYEVTPSARGFSKMDLGFNHFHITPTQITTQFINGNGERLHAFRRQLDGRVETI